MLDFDRARELFGAHEPTTFSIPMTVVNGAFSPQWYQTGVLWLAIDPSSDVDTVHVSCRSGDFDLSVGAPLMGPLRGPFTFTVPYPVPSSYSSVIVPASGPQLVLQAGYVDAPKVTTRKTNVYSVAALSITSATMVALAEFPAYGRGTIDLAIANTGITNGGSYDLRGRYYRTLNAGGVDEISLLTATQTIGTSTQALVNVSGLACDTVMVYALSANGSTFTARARLR